MIAYEQRDAVALATIDRPDRRNALDHEALAGLADAIAQATAAGSRAFVLTGAGGHFCAGADLTTVEDEGFTDALLGVLTSLGTAPFVAIAAIEGAALGAGTQLSVACDLRVATADASFGVPAGKLGLSVDQWTVRRVVDLAGGGPARAMLLGGEVVSGADAHRVGLVQRIGGLDDALGWAGSIAALAPLTLRAHKAAIEGADDALDARSRAWSSADLQEGLAAFRERRPPVFRGE